MGAIGVIASLVYLASQVRQAQRVARAENVREAQAAYSRVLQMLVEDGELAAIYDRGCKDPSRLEGVELSRFNYLFLLQFVAFTEIHTAHQRGLMDHVLYERWRAAFANHLQTPGGTRWWAGARSVLKSDVVRALDELRDAVPTPEEVLAPMRRSPDEHGSAL